MTDPLAAWRTSVDSRISRTLESTIAATSEAGAEVSEITEPMLDAAAGGKRLRALLLLASHAAHAPETAEGPGHEAAIDVAAALELFQTAALLHDDVLDDSDTRRGKPAAHRRIARVHGERGWLGSALSFGAAGGILAGDLTLMACQRALVRATAVLGTTRASTVAEMFVDMSDLVTAGQYMDMRAAAQPIDALDRQHDQIIGVMRSKTASYTCEFPLALGAAIAGADGAQVATMREVGLDLGIAFQLRDDLLGLHGAPEVTGKPTGDDIREGKRTLVLWRAWTQTDEIGKEAIRDTLGVRDASTDQVSRVLEVIAATDAEQWCEAHIDLRATRARATLDGASLHPEGAAVIDELIGHSVTRSH
ncbi:polyprenyl synthetase family protein [Demequina sp.]|uniref:polyprenyl synthetase family protein n=1 Tax=Demequina sp. TaxID=2050685 RepID=UPI003A84DB9C